MFTKNKYISALGLMSGTSMDGIDGSIIISNGIEVKENRVSNKTNYSNTTIKLLFAALNNISEFLNDNDTQQELSYKVTIDHAVAAKNLIDQSSIIPDVVGFHGQTILHSPQQKKTLQLGDGKLLSQLLKTNVVSQFRENDIFHGGEGAPIAPIYHKMLIKNYNLNLPACIINIGGISNITYFDGIELIGFDTGPGNGLMDSYMQKYLKSNYDYNGQLSSTGSIDWDLVKKFTSNNYFSRLYPKSLDRNDFQTIYSLLQSKQLSHADSMATLAEFTVASIDISIKTFSKKPKNIVLVGGGTKNKNLVKKLKKLFGNTLILSEEIGFSSLIVEAELIGYLAVRKLYSLPITFPKTTGVYKPLVGGKIHYYS